MNIPSKPRIIRLSPSETALVDYIGRQQSRVDRFSSISVASLALSLIAIGISVCQ